MPAREPDRLLHDADEPARLHRLRGESVLLQVQTVELQEIARATRNMAKVLRDAARQTASDRRRTGR